MKKKILLMFIISVLCLMLFGTLCAFAATSGDFSYRNLGTQVMITGYNGSGTEVEIPAEINGIPVTSIGNTAFYSCTNIKSVVIPDSVTVIAVSAFENCINLESIDFSENLGSIGSSAFSGGRSLKAVELPSSLKSIGDSAFSNCEGFVSIVIPDGVTSIGDSVFYSCDNLESITLSQELTSIGNSAFSGCESLEGVSVPSKVESIGDSAFSGCSNLKNIDLSQGITDIAYGTFSNCTSLESVTIPDGVTTVAGEAFLNCSKLKEITFPESLSSIGRYAFRYCTGLEKVRFMGTEEAQGSLYTFDSGVDVVYEYSPEAGIEFFKTTQELSVDEEIILTPIITNGAGDVEWKSDNEAVATVTAGGKVVAHSFGVAKITATLSGTDKSADCMIYVGGGVHPAKIIYDDFSGTISVSARETGTLYVVTYSLGVLKRVAEYVIKQGETNNICTFNTNQKAFVWTEKLKPLCEAFTLSQGGISGGGASGGGSSGGGSSGGSSSTGVCGANTVPFVITELEAISENTYNIYGYNGKSVSTLTNPLVSSPESYALFTQLALDKGGKGYVVRFGKDSNGNVTLDEKNIIFSNDSSLRATVMSNHANENCGWTQSGDGCYIRGTASGTTYEMIWGYVHSVGDSYVNILDKNDEDAAHIYTSYDNALVLKYEEAGSSFDIIKLEDRVDAVLDTETLKFGETNPTEVFTYGTNGTTLQLVIIKG